ncbi:MAG: transcriptional regulator [Flexibacter sp. CG_4_10_14_3_um_filter_32_15]|nr:MAG: transcriptional regulator [Flexibacter sp. CG_4_10_14_3_um_filter_32_15]
MKLKTLKEHLEKEYGKVGTPTREEFDKNSKAFAIGELIKEARKEAQLTQTQLAEKAGTTKNYISRIENGQSDIQMTTLFRIIELGLGKQLSFTIK